VSAVQPQTICFTLAEPLPLLNRLLRTSHWVRSKQRAALAWEIASKIPYWSRPQVPFSHATITVTRYSVGRPDPDAFQTKHLLDVLQPMNPKSCPNGLGIIRVDSAAGVTLIPRAERVASRSEQCTVVLIEGIA
jgi:hypothetical protein